MERIRKIDEPVPMMPTPSPSTTSSISQQQQQGLAHHFDGNGVADATAVGARPGGVAIPPGRDGCDPDEEGQDDGSLQHHQHSAAQQRGNAEPGQQRQ